MAQDISGPGAAGLRLGRLPCVKVREATLRHVHALGTVADVLDWHEAHLLRAYSPLALKERKRIWTLFRDYCHGMKLEDCLPAHLLDFITERHRITSNNTRRRWKATIDTPFNEAERLGLIPKNPFRGIRFSRGPRGRDWSDEEYRAILRASKPYFRRFIVFMRMSGARPGEARTLRWDEVRNEVDAIVQSEHKTSWAGPEPRRIHFNHVLVKLLLWLRKHRVNGQQWVFQNSCGRQWTPYALAWHLRSVRKAAGLSPQVKLHGGRHTFATNAIMNGVDLATLAELLGHRSVQATANYLHLAHKRAHLNAAADRAIGRK